MQLLKLTIKRRIIILMGLLATIYPILLTGLMVYFYYLFGVERLFSNSINDAVEETVKVAQLYLNEHKEKVKIDALSIANNLNRNHKLVIEYSALLQMLVDQLANARGVAEIMVFRDRLLIVKNSLSFSSLFENIKSEIIKKLDTQEVVLLEDNSENKVRAIAKIPYSFGNTYVLVGRYIDSSILEHLKKTEGSAKEYRTILDSLDINKKKLQILFLFSAMLLLLISILIARKMALFITKPIEEISLATISLQNGDFSKRVPENRQHDEIYQLARAFNMMTEKISDQRDELLKEHNISENRRKFIEVVLAEILVGVIAINTKNEVIISNNIATKILNLSNNITGEKIKKIFPEIMNMVTITKKEYIESQCNDMSIERDGKIIHLYTRTGPVLNDKEEISSIIITFSDITELLQHQKLATWADVARRIAHEIKNPLTPISLAAERLKKKYYAQLQSEQGTFLKYIDTIINHVGGIEKMVSEFSEFAKIGGPIISSNNLSTIIEESLLLQKIANPEIIYSIEGDYKELYVECDRGQILRVFNNLFGNAADAIKAKQQSNIEENYQGNISIKITKIKHIYQAMIKIYDNGIGIKADMINAVLEPYITTKKNGTGLGLAIVKKIIEEHGGKFILNNIEGGACASFSLPFHKGQENG